MFSFSAGMFATQKSELFLVFCRNLIQNEKVH